MNKHLRPDNALSVRGLVKHFRRGLLGRKDPQPAVDRVDLDVARGSVRGLIGESGSGKTTLARAALGLMPFDAGQVYLLGNDLAAMDAGALRRFRRRVQLLFQNPDAHLNPGLDVRAILAESARLHRPERPNSEVVAEALEQVGISHRAHAMPHELSGGEKRRVGIARVLIADPDLVVADEPTAGLDAALKADLIDLLLSRRSDDRGYLLISHDLPLVAYATDQVSVMLAGRIVEEMPTALIGRTRHHPYTEALLAAAGLAPEVEHDDTDPVGRTARGCPYRGPCPYATSPCATITPLLVEREPGHQVACHAAGDA